MANAVIHFFDSFANKNNDEVQTKTTENSLYWNNFILFWGG